MHTLHTDKITAIKSSCSASPATYPWYLLLLCLCCLLCKYLHGYINVPRAHTAPHATHAEHKQAQKDMCCSTANKMPHKTVNKAVEIDREGKGRAGRKQKALWGRVGSCIRKVTQCQGDEGERKWSKLMGERCRNWRGELKRKRRTGP